MLQKPGSTTSKGGGATLRLLQTLRGGRIAAAGRRLSNNNELVFLGPVNAYITFWTLFPLLFMLVISLTNWKIPHPAKFIGLDNYVKALTDPLFWYSMWITVRFALLAGLIEVGFGFAVALLLNRPSRLSAIIRPLLIVPMVLTPVVTAMIWRYLYNPTSGPLNYILSLVGLGPSEWYSDPATVWQSLLLIDVWQWMPFPALLILSGLYALPRDLFEAAEVDGASGVQKFVYVTLPLLRPLMLAAFLLRFLDALKIFDTVFVLTRGGPGTMTEVLSFHIYRFGIGEYFRVGYGASMSVLVLLLSAGISLLLMKFFMRDGESYIV